MASTIQIKRSSTPGAIPSTLVAGELALNRADGELYYLDASDQIVSLLDIDCGEIAPGSISFWQAELDGNWHWSD
jgi:hypothetical protein